MKWTAKRITYALLRSNGYRDGTLFFTETSLDGCRADVLCVARSRHVTEFEIKCSVADWRADQHKEKFKPGQAHTPTYFYYVVPVDIAAKVLTDPLFFPAWLPPYAGVMTVREEGRFDRVDTLRKATRRREGVKMADADLNMNLRGYYWRYWAAEYDRLTREFRREEIK